MSDAQTDGSVLGNSRENRRIALGQLLIHMTEFLREDNLVNENILRTSFEHNLLSEDLTVETFVQGLRTKDPVVWAEIIRVSPNGGFLPISPFPGAELVFVEFERSCCLFGLPKMVKNENSPLEGGCGQVFIWQGRTLLHQFPYKKRLSVKVHWWQ